MDGARACCSSGKRTSRRERASIRFLARRQLQKPRSVRLGRGGLFPIPLPPETWSHSESLTVHHHQRYHIRRGGKEQRRAEWRTTCSHECRELSSGFEWSDWPRVEPCMPNIGGSFRRQSHGSVTPALGRSFVPSRHRPERGTARCPRPPIHSSLRGIAAHQLSALVIGMASVNHFCPTAHRRPGYPLCAVLDFPVWQCQQRADQRRVY